MNAREAGFLLLSSHLGNPERNPLTPPQLRNLAKRVLELEKPEEDRPVTGEDLLRLGYSREMTGRILSLLGEEERLSCYCGMARKHGCFPLTRVSSAYPVLLRRRLGLDSPGCLWYKGDVSVLKRPAIALVGSRDLREENRKFAHKVGEIAGENGWALVSGNARGADREGQNACIAAGGKVISIVADRLCNHREDENILYLSEDGFGDAFTAKRALSRNRCIHALGYVTFVAQCGLGKGGTWSGTTQNLRQGWSMVICCRDGSEASEALSQMGAYLLDAEELETFTLSDTESQLQFGI